MSKLPAVENTKKGYVLGLTGGIATGKSTVAAVFQKHGIPIIDGDLIAREAVAPQTPGLAAIVKEFGKEMLQEDGQLDRKKLGNIIFSSEEDRHRLDQLLDPFIRTRIKEQINRQREVSSLVVVDIPLLYEGHYDRYMDAVAVVYTTEAVQIERLMARNQLTEKEAKQRIASQLSVEKKKQLADIVFDNNGTKEQLTTQVEKWLFAFFDRFL